MLGLSVSNSHRGRETDASRPIYNKYAKGIWDINKSTIRLRRDSDNAEQDFPPLAGRYLDTASITAWAGSDSVYCTTIYDASGNGNHATQSTAAEQPRLVNAGVFEVDSNGDYSLYYDGTDDKMQCSDQVFTSGNVSATLFSKFNTEKTALQTICGTETVLKYQLRSDGTFQQLSSVDGASWEVIKPFSSYVANQVYLLATVSDYDNTNNKGYIDSTLVYTDPTFGGIGSNSNKFTIGALVITSPFTEGEFFQGHITAVSVFDKALTQAQVTTLTNRLS